MLPSRNMTPTMIRTNGPVIERRFIDGRRMLFHATYAQRRNRTADEIRRHPNFESLKATLGAMARLTVQRRLHARSHDPPAVGAPPVRQPVAERRQELSV